jgi:Flp pilus assembly protein TadB
MCCLYCKLDSTEQCGIKKTIDKASEKKNTKFKRTKASKQEQGVLQEFCTVHLYITAGVVAVTSCRSLLLQLLLLLLLVLVLLLLLLQWQQTRSHVKKNAACGDMHGNWGACSQCKQRVPKLFLFFLPLQFSFINPKP